MTIGLAGGSEVSLVAAPGKRVKFLFSSGLPPACPVLVNVVDLAVSLRIRRLVSSLLRPSSSDSEPSSKVSCKVLSASVTIGSSDESNCRDAIDEARDLNDGGGEEGTVF